MGQIRADTLVEIAKKQNEGKKKRALKGRIEATADGYIATTIGGCAAATLSLAIRDSMASGVPFSDAYRTLIGEQGGIDYVISTYGGPNQIGINVRLATEPEYYSLSQRLVSTFDNIYLNLIVPKVYSGSWLGKTIARILVSNPFAGMIDTAHHVHEQILWYEETAKGALIGKLRKAIGEASNNHPYSSSLTKASEALIESNIRKPAQRPTGNLLYNLGAIVSEEINYYLWGKTAQRVGLSNDYIPSVREKIKTGPIDGTQPCKQMLYAGTQ